MTYLSHLDTSITIVPTQIVLWHSQPFIASHFHFLVLCSRRAAQCYWFSGPNKSVASCHILHNATAALFTREFLSHPQYCLGAWSKTWEVADTKITRKWEWLIVNGCEGIFSHSKTNKWVSKLCSGIMLRIMTPQCNKWAILKVVFIYCDLFCKTYRTLL